MQQLTKNNQAPLRIKNIVSEITPALLSCFWWLIIVICMVFLLAAAANPQATDNGWPRTIRSDGTRIDVYQPQVDKWENGRLEDRVAMAVTEKGSDQSTYGTAWLSARTTVDQDKRMVTLYDVEVKKITFPSAGSKESRYASAATEALQHWDFTIALDRLLADIAIAQNEGKATGDNLNSTPPKIFIRDDPAVLILIDGEPELQKVPDTKFMRVVNTPAVIVLDTGSGRYFLRGAGYWLSAASVNGHWSKAPDAPTALSALVEVSEQTTEAADQGGGPPEVIVSTEPAELIQINGEAQFSPIEDTRLLYVTNTDSDVFMSLPQQSYYVLLSGRWFNAATLDGPWESVPVDSLPTDFSRIPGGHPKSAVLASVPGTPEARDAVVAAQVPQTATVDRKSATFTATYDGDPQFKRVANTDMSYAANSPDDVIKARGKYYAVSNGIWFVADNPLGPWSVCDFVPPEIYSIPPTVPVYHVKYVYVYDSTPDWVYVGYTPGYFGAFVWNGVVVYGTGFYYPPWYSHSYFAWPWTWGFGFHYAYWGGGFYWRPWYPRPWYWHRWRFEHNPPLWWGRVVYNRSVDRRVNQFARHNASVYDRWKAPAVISRHPVPLRAPGRIAARPEMMRTRPGTPRRDLYSDRNGQVYSHQNDGWYRRNGQKWEKISPRAPQGRPPQQQPRTGPPQGRTPQPQAKPPGAQGPAARDRRFEELERDRQARTQGQRRADQYNRMPPATRTTSPPPRISAPTRSAPRTQAPSQRAPAQQRGGRRR
jgi:hypothetical protein